MNEICNGSNLLVSFFGALQNNESDYDKRFIISLYTSKLKAFAAFMLVSISLHLGSYKVQKNAFSLYMQHVTRWFSEKKLG